MADERIATNNGRVTHQDWLLRELRTIFATLSKTELLGLCEKADLPFAPIAHPEDLFNDLHLTQSGGLLETTLPDDRTTKLPRTPIQLGDQNWDLRHDPPQVGVDTANLLADMGYTTDEIQALATAQIIVA